MLRNYDCREATVAANFLACRMKKVCGWRPGYNRVSKFGIVAQLVAQMTFNHLVVGSSPTDPTKEILWQTEIIVWKL